MSDASPDSPQADGRYSPAGGAGAAEPQSSAGPSPGGDNSTVCRVTVLTPPGRGAVASVSVVGENATEHVAEFFASAAQNRPLGQFPIRRVLFGRWFAGGGVGEEVVVCRHSDREIHVHCHGGRVAVEAIMHSLVARGCRETPWAEYLALQAENRIAAEARIALATAPTERTAAILLDQLRGALHTALAEVGHLIVTGRQGAAEQRLRKLLEYAPLGRHLNRRYRVVLTGRPNVGKSSLINALLGYQRSIVFEQPGTTRDVVTAHTAFGGWPVELADTAGLRHSDCEIEAAGVRRAKSTVSSADLIVLVFDASFAWGDQDDALLREWPQGLTVHNKCDSILEDRNRPPGFTTSALNGDGIPQLAEKLAEQLVPVPPSAGTAVPFTSRQIDGIDLAAWHLKEGHAERAFEIIGELIA